MTTDEFEELLQKVVVDPNRLISEVLQLENYVFRDSSFTENPSYKYKLLLYGSTNDLDEVLCWNKNKDDPFPELIAFRKEIYNFVAITRSELTK